MFSRLFGKKPPNVPMRDVTALTAPLSTPALHVVANEAPSLSHLGGSPNLPAGMPWPEHDGTKLGFLARLSLSEVHSACPFPWLPSLGALLFFLRLRETALGIRPEAQGWMGRTPCARLGGTTVSDRFGFERGPPSGTASLGHVPPGRHFAILGLRRYKNTWTDQRGIRCAV